MKILKFQKMTDWNELSSIAWKRKFCRIYWQWILVEQTSLYTVVYRAFLYNPTNLKVSKKAPCWTYRKLPNQFLHRRKKRAPHQLVCPWEYQANIGKATYVRRKNLPIVLFGKLCGKTYTWVLQLLRLYYHVLLHRPMLNTFCSTFAQYNLRCLLYRFNSCFCFAMSYTKNIFTSWQTASYSCRFP